MAEALGKSATVLNSIEVLSTWVVFQVDEIEPRPAVLATTRENLFVIYLDARMQVRRR